jgi:tRNA(fMet)-specific endonuclease VapC
MSRYLLDTDWVVDVLNGKDTAVQTVLDLAPSGLAVSIITYGELYEGAAFAHDPEPALAGLRSFLKGKDILPLTPAIMERFAHIRGSLPRQVRQQISDLDILIAATCLEHDLILLTRNLKDFHILGYTSRSLRELGGTPSRNFRQYRRLLLLISLSHHLLPLCQLPLNGCPNFTGSWQFHPQRQPASFFGVLRLYK